MVGRDRAARSASGDGGEMILRRKADRSNFAKAPQGVEPEAAGKISDRGTPNF